MTSSGDVVTIEDMKKMILVIAVMAALLTCGCTETQTVQKGASIEGLTLQDLAPSTAEQLPPAIRFKLLTFEVPRQNLLQMTSLFNALSKENIKFSNRKAFDRNAFNAGIGNKEMWSLIGNELKAVKAKKTSTANITLQDRKGFEIPIKEVLDDVSLVYTNENSRVVQDNIFSSTIAFRIKAGPAARRRGTTLIRLDALSRSQNPTFISRAAGNEEFGLTVFRSLSMMMEMEEGQFLILAPQADLAKAKTEASATMNLAELFFFSRGDLLTDKQDDDPVTLEGKKYEFQRNIALARIYMLICIEVQN